MSSGPPQWMTPSYNCMSLHYAARLLSLWKRRFPEHNATESSLTTRVRRVRKLRSTPTATVTLVVLKTTRG